MALDGVISVVFGVALIAWPGDVAGWPVPLLP